MKNFSKTGMEMQGIEDYKNQVLAKLEEDLEKYSKKGRVRPKPLSFGKEPNGYDVPKAMMDSEFLI